MIKLAPVAISARAHASSSFHLELCLTGQHQTLAEEALSIFGLKENHDLGIMTPNQSLNDISKSIFDRLPPVLEKSKPDVVLVQGDTTSAAASAMCAFHLNIAVAHVEAGLRSHNLNAPFPEELNRKIISCAAHYNFAPTELAKNNLLSESIRKETIMVSGNTVVDALRIIQEKYGLDDIGSIDSSLRAPFVLVSAHRRESFGTGIRRISEALKHCARRHPGIQFVYPVHVNPNVDKPVREILSGVSNILLLHPISYLHILTLMKHALFIVTDSGGIQEEAPSFGKFCIVLRDLTERVESVNLGLSELVGTSPERIIDAISRRISEASQMSTTANPYGDGHAAERILERLDIERQLS